jgi:hypothetical protein
MAKREPILALDTLVERRTVRIDGVEHELMNVGELSLLTYHQIGKDSARIDELRSVSDLTDDQVIEFAGLLDKLCRRLLLAPDEVHARLTDPHRLAVVHAFSSLQREQAQAPLAGVGAAAPTGTETPAPSTGESTSPV